MSWLRLDTSWAYSEWLITLSAEARLSWIQMLCYIKAHGTKGEARVLPDLAASRMWFVGEESVRQMLLAAKAAGALSIEGHTWVINEWEKYQGDPTNKKRQKEYRDRHIEPDDNDDVTLRNGESRCVTEETVNNDNGDGDGDVTETRRDGDVTGALLRSANRGLTRYPDLTSDQVSNLIGTFNLSNVEHSQLQSEVFKFNDYFSRKPSKANQPSTYSALMNWFQKVEWKQIAARRPQKPEKMAQHTDEEGYGYYANN